MSAAEQAWEPAAPQWQVEGVARAIDRIGRAAARNKLAPGMARAHRTALACVLRDLCFQHHLQPPPDLEPPVQEATLQQRLEALRAAYMYTQQDIDAQKNRQLRHYTERDRWGIASVVRELRARQGVQPC